MYYLNFCLQAKQLYYSEVERREVIDKLAYFSRWTACNTITLNPTDSDSDPVMMHRSDFFAQKWAMAAAVVPLHSLHITFLCLLDSICKCPSSTL